MSEVPLYGGRGAFHKSRSAERPLDDLYVSLSTKQDLERGYTRQSRPDSGTYKTVKAEFWHI